MPGEQRVAGEGDDVPADEGAAGVEEVAAPLYEKCPRRERGTEECPYAAAKNAYAGDAARSGGAGNGGPDDAGVFEYIGALVDVAVVVQLLLKLTCFGPLPKNVADSFPI